MLRIMIGCMLVFLAGCDSERIARLEKQNQELQAQIQKQHAAENLESQAKCSRDSKIWFNENWQRDQDTILLDYTNHYNKEMNKCFILVEYHYSLKDKRGSWVNDMSLWDVYENSKYGQFSESHRVLEDFKTADSVISCAPPSGGKCSAMHEFNDQIRTYLNN